MASALDFVVAALSEKFNFDYDEAMNFISKPVKKSKKIKEKLPKKPPKNYYLNLGNRLIFLFRYLGKMRA